MENLPPKVRVEYCGNKSFCVDNVARSGKSWEGKGDVQEVTQAQAKILVSYSDQWKLADDETANLDQPTIITVQDGQGATTQIEEGELSIPVDKMTVVQLIAYAQTKFGKTFKPKTPRKVLLDEVILLEHGPQNY